MSRRAAPTAHRIAARSAEVCRIFRRGAPKAHSNAVRSTKIVQ